MPATSPALDQREAGDVRRDQRRPPSTSPPTLVAKPWAPAIPDVVLDDLVDRPLHVAVAARPAACRRPLAAGGQRPDAVDGTAQRLVHEVRAELGREPADAAGRDPLPTRAADAHPSSVPRPWSASSLARVRERTLVPWLDGGHADRAARRPAGCSPTCSLPPGTAAPTTWSGWARTSSRARCSRPTARGCSRCPPTTARGRDALVVAGGARGAAARRAARLPVAAAVRAPHGGAGRHRLRRGDPRPAPTPPRRRLDRRARCSRPTPGCTSWAGRTRWRPGSDGELVGGLYGVAVGGLFAGESMFHRVTDASKVALVGLVDLLRDEHADRRVLDVQWATDHLASLGRGHGARARRTSRCCGAPPTSRCRAPFR